MKSLLEGLNAEQKTAVTLPAQPALVLAGAGSGKTRVLTTRIAWLLQHHFATPSRILAVTFTNKAAREMRERIMAFNPQSLENMWIGTFHSLCYRMLRMHAAEVNLSPRAQVIDHADQLAIVKKILKETPAFSTMSEALDAKELVQFINRQKEEGLRFVDVAKMPNMAQKSDELAVYRFYESYCREHSALDFPELLLLSFELLLNNQTLREHYQKRFLHILVDEFQDTNNLQYAWLKLLAAGGAAVFAVGDDDQSIYRFRGAQVGNMSLFLEEFNVKTPIRLEQNYRSTGNILSAANALIANNEVRLGKNLRTDAPAGEKLQLVVAPDDRVEAKIVATEIQLLQIKGCQLKDIAVLYRRNAQSFAFEQAFMQNRIAHVLHGATRFFERQEVKHALAYARLMVDANNDLAFLRVVNVPPRGIGPRTVQNIADFAESQGITLFEAARLVAQKNGKVAAFVNLILSMQEQVSEKSLLDIMQIATCASGLREWYAKNELENHDRLQNLNELENAAAQFSPSQNMLDEEMREVIDVDNVVDQLRLFLDENSLSSSRAQDETDDNAVNLMTVHSAKGLEFQNVFVVGLEEGLFPSDYSLWDERALEEERRLMYVALTRAKKRLFLSYASRRQMRGSWRDSAPSRFVKEVPRHLIYSSHSPVTNTFDRRISVADSLFMSKNRDSNIRLSANFYASKREAAGSKSLFNKEETFDGFCIGENVRHAKFGVGVIVDAVQKEASARLKVNFGKYGEIELDTQVAKLTKL